MSEPVLSAPEQRWYLAHRNVIPPMVHPYARYWSQPSIAAIEIDDTHALMGKHAFDRLAEYSFTDPTGAYEGKMWKRQVGPEQWLLCWYGVSEKEGYVSNNYREILLA